MSLLLAAALTICAPGPRDNCVVDGDTFWWHGQKVRIENIDTPEMNGKCATERLAARAARDRLRRLLNARPFRLQGSGSDRYGRALRRVLSGGVDVGRVMINEGHARPWIGRREGWC